MTKPDPLSNAIAHVATWLIGALLVLVPLALIVAVLRWIAAMLGA